MLEKKARRSMLTSTACPACEPAKVCTPRPATNPWARSCTGIGASTWSSSRRWIARNRGFGASISRCGSHW